MNHKTTRAKQLLAVWRVMEDGKWHRLEWIECNVRGTTASISARIRDLRKAKYGGHAIESKPSPGGGSWSYRLVK